jgi:hypothetical protein
MQIIMPPVNFSLTRKSPLWYTMPVQKYASPAVAPENSISFASGCFQTNVLVYHAQVGAQHAAPQVATSNRKERKRFGNTKEREGAVCSQLELRHNYL